MRLRREAWDPRTRLSDAESEKEEEGGVERTRDGDSAKTWRLAALDRQRGPHRVDDRRGGDFGADILR